MAILGKLLSDGLGDAGEDIVKKAVKKATEEGGESILSKIGKKIPVSYTDDIAQDIAVKAPEMQKLYRGIKAETPEKLEQYIADMLDPTIKPRTYEGAAHGEGYYFTPSIGSAEGYAGNDLARPYQAVLEINQPKNRFIGINKKNQNRPVDFVMRAEKRVGGGRANSVGERDFDNYLKKNGILGDRVSDNITVIKDNDALKNMKVVGRRNAKETPYWTYTDVLEDAQVAKELDNATPYLSNTMYHSTNSAPFSKFDDSKLGSATGYDNTAFGHFITDDLDFSKTFGKNTLQVQPSFKNPITHPMGAQYKYSGDELDKIVEDYFIGTNNTAGLDSLKQSAAENGQTLWEEFMDTTIDNNPYDFINSEKDALIKNGYDAVEFVEGPKNQLKGLEDNAKFANNTNPVSSYAVFNPDDLKILGELKESGADKYLPKKLGVSSDDVAQSIPDDSGITLYHGTPNKFENFDESLPSVWFSDSDKNLRDTGLSIKGSQPMNVMKRQLPKDLKIADEDLADRLTKQQLQDRGYAGIAYTERGPNGDETYYEIFSPNKTLRKMPDVQQSLEPSPDVKMSYYDGYGSGGGFAKDVKTIGTKDVAPIDPDTLPEGYDFYRKITDMNKAKYGYVYDAVSKETGKPARRVTNADLRQYLEDYYPDYISGDKMTKYDMEKAIQDAIEDELADEAWENGADLSALVHNKYPRAGMRDIYNDHSGRTGKLDRELSRRLGIGESNSVMMDRLNNDTERAAGDVSENRVGIKFDNWSSDEDKVGVMGHERLHLFQNAANRNDFNYEKVKPVYQELHEDLKKALLNEDEIRKAHSGSEFERMGGMDYWGSDIEQEARMLEAYLYSEGYVKGRPYRLDEFASKMDIIKPAFDKFFDKLRALSKAGVALPAIAAVFGLAGSNGKDGDKNA